MSNKERMSEGLVSWEPVQETLNTEANKLSVSFHNGLEWVPIDKLNDKKLNPEVMDVDMKH